MWKPICKLFNLHDWEDIPAPTNPFYGTESPGLICLNCGIVMLIDDISILSETREILTSIRSVSAKIRYNQRFASPGPYYMPRIPNK